MLMNSTNGSGLAIMHMVTYAFIYAAFYSYDQANSKTNNEMKTN